jgi:hypothetical protein
MRLPDSTSKLIALRDLVEHPGWKVLVEDVLMPAHNADSAVLDVTRDDIEAERIRGRRAKVKEILAMKDLVISALEEKKRAGTFSVDEVSAE